MLNNLTNIENGEIEKWRVIISTLHVSTSPHLHVSILFVVFVFMIVHKIQSSEGNFVALEVKEQKNERCLCISKGGSLLIFNQQQTHQLNAIVQSIDAGNYALKEYGSFKKGSEIFKVSLSAFRGIKSFQIREWLQSSTYNGFGKQGISLPTYKIKELQTHLTSILQEFAEQSSEGASSGEKKDM